MPFLKNYWGWRPINRKSYLQRGCLPLSFKWPKQNRIVSIDRCGRTHCQVLGKKGEGIKHVAFEVDDIKAEMAQLAAEGFTLLNEVPKKGADNKWVGFVHPKSAEGVLVELCQKIK